MSFVKWPKRDWVFCQSLYVTHIDLYSLSIEATFGGIDKHLGNAIYALTSERHKYDDLKRVHYTHTTVSQIKSKWITRKFNQIPASHKSFAK